MFGVKAILSVVAFAAHADGSSVESLSLIQQFAAKAPPQSPAAKASEAQLLQPAAKALPPKSPPAKQSPSAKASEAQQEKSVANASSRPKKQSIMEASETVATHQKLFSTVNSQMKELEHKRAQVNSKMQASYEKALKTQEQENKALKKSNDHSAKEVQKLQTKNGAFEAKIAVVTKKNENLLEILKNRKDNLTAALAFSVSTEEEYLNSMQNESLASMLADVRAAKTPESLLQQTVDATLDFDGNAEDIVGKLSSIVGDVSKGQAEYESILNAKFEEKFKVGEEIHQSLLKEQESVNATKVIELKRHDDLEATWKSVTGIFTKLNTEVTSLKKFAQGFKGQPMQATLLTHPVDEAKFNSIRSHTQSMVSTPADGSTSHGGWFLR